MCVLNFTIFLSIEYILEYLKKVTKFNLSQPLNAGKMQSFCNILFCPNIGYIKILYHPVLSSRHVDIKGLG